MDLNQLLPQTFASFQIDIVHQTKVEMVATLERNFGNEYACFVLESSCL
jgi:hypothetical protein